MTAPTDAFAAIAQRSQEATTAAVRTWTDTVNAYATSFSAENPLPKPADVHAAVDTWFDLAGSLLAEQRAFATTVLDAGTEAAGTITERVSAAVAPKRG
jgi:hypothetical protein